MSFHSALSDITRHLCEIIKCGILLFKVLDVDFDSCGRMLCTSSQDATARVWDVRTLQVMSVMEGHQLEVSKACFSPGGFQLLTTSADHSARVWTVETGACVQLLDGHRDDVFSCAFNYDGAVIVTASKDCTARVWRLPNENVLHNDDEEVSRPNIFSHSSL